MAASTSELDAQSEAERLLRDHTLYDRNVDIVSAFEALFTLQESISSLVSHFDRFPSIKHKDGNVATPDFSVLFNDDTALVAEIANISNHPNSLEKLCKQLLRYDSLTQVPAGRNKMRKVRKVDVLYLTPAATTNDAVDRILGERLATSDHFYKPSEPPTIAEHSRDSDKYAFVRNRDPRNGALSQQEVQKFIDRGGYKAPGSFWTPIKAQRPFINDTTSLLYLATVIWIKVLPVILKGAIEGQTTAAEIADTLKKQYEKGRISEVLNAVDLLGRGGLASVDTNGTIKVKRQTRRRNEADFARYLTERACAPAKGIPRRRRRMGIAGSNKAANRAAQLDLFEDD